MTPPAGAPEALTTVHELHELLGIDALQHPERLPWLLALALAALVLAWRRSPGALPWPGLPEAAAAGARARELLPIWALGARALGLVCLATAMAGPVGVTRDPPPPGMGLDLVLVVDTSGSMRALDAGVGQASRTRLDLAKEVVSRFARQRAAEGDRVGLVVFGRSAFTQSPLTSDGELLSAALARVEIGVAGEATALGDALALAVKRVRGATRGLGRVIVLLTDGRSNAGAIPLSVATELAAHEDVRVHTVGIGTAGVEVPMAAGPGDPRAMRFERHDPDLDALRRVAEATGGRFHPARRSTDLESVYREIDALERAPRSLPPQLRQTPRPEPLLAAAGGMLLFELALTRVLRRRLP